MYRYRRQLVLKRWLLILIPLFVSILFYALIKTVFYSEEKQALRAVQTFYAHEQDGDFASSWEMFHPYMKEKFAKAQYIQDRAHVFLNHFGVETFDVAFEKPVKMENWSMEKGRKPLPTVYKIPVNQTYKGKYGNFSIRQPVYAVKEKDQWLILWSYER